MQKDFVTVSVVILNHNGKHFLRECLTSVSDQKFDSYEIIVVDNGSTDGSVSYVNEHFPHVRIIESDRNLGFAEGNNLGVREARGRLVVLLNNDTVVEQAWLSGLVEAVEPESVAVAASCIYTEGIPAKYYEKNGTVNFLGHNIMRAFDEPTDIFFAGGASLIFKKDILGLPFDPDYLVYAEDVYLSLRARFQGHQVKHTNASRVFHVGSGTAKKKSVRWLTYYQERNRLLNVLLFFSLLTLFRLVPIFILNTIIKLVVAAVSRRWSFAGILQSYIWLLLHPYTIHKKRLALQKERKVHEREVMAKMSGKLMNGETLFERLLNACALSYCWMVGLRTIEFTKHQ